MELDYKIIGKKFDLIFHNNSNFEIKEVRRNEKLFYGITDYLIDSSGNQIKNFVLKKLKIRNDGNRKRYIFESHFKNEEINLVKTVNVATYINKDVFVIDVEYHLLSGTLEIENVIRNEIFISNDKRFWSFQGASYSDRPDWISPVTPGYHKENFMGMNSSDYGGGIPFVDVWSKSVGIAIGLIEKTPLPVSLPVSNDDEIRIRILENRHERLHAPSNYIGYKTVLIPHHGDFFDPLEQYSKLLTSIGLDMRKKKYPQNAYLSQWGAWGYGRNFSYKGQYMTAILKTLDKVKELGFGWVVIDDGWQDNYGDWGINELAFKDQESDLLETVRQIHQRGLKVGIWFIPFAVAKDSKILKNNPEILVLDKDSKHLDIDFWDSYYVCPTHKKTKEITISLVKKLISFYDFDGLKVDGQHINAIPFCFNKSHNHKNEIESYTSSPKIIKLIYDTAHTIKKNAMVEICPCGTCASVYNMPSCDLPVASDPKSSFQVRHRGKAFKALLGRRAPYFGDYVELTESGEDFASTIGIGGIPGSMFTLKEINIGRYPLTDQKTKNIKKWIGIYNTLRLSEGRYLNLYDIIFDQPETHVIKKNEKLYYSLFAEEFSGEFEFRGLAKNKEYEIFDIESGKKLGNVGKDRKSIYLNFEHHIIILAIPKSIGD